MPSGEENMQPHHVCTPPPRDRPLLPPAWQTTSKCDHPRPSAQLETNQHCAVPRCQECEKYCKMGVLLGKNSMVRAQAAAKECERNL